VPRSALPCPHAARARVAEVFAALSLTTDLATGVPFEKGLRTRALATAFATELGLDDADRSAVFHVALLRSMGCTAHASENAALFADDTTFEGALNRLDPGDARVFAAGLPRPWRAWPCDLTDRGVEVLRLAARGSRTGRSPTNCGSPTGPSDTTWPNVFDKTGRR
jgi:hypothetical protein